MPSKPSEPVVVRIAEEYIAAYTPRGTLANYPRDAIEDGYGIARAFLQLRTTVEALTLEVNASRHSEANAITAMQASEARAAALIKMMQEMMECSTWEQHHAAWKKARALLDAALAPPAQDASEKETGE